MMNLLKHFPSTALMAEYPMNRLAASLFGVVIA
jgi:hypothetical protein